MADEEPKPRQSKFAVAGESRQSTLFSFSPEARAQLQGTGLFVPPAPIPRREAAPPREIRVPTPLVPSAAIVPGLPVIPEDVTARWRVPPGITPRDDQVNAVNQLIAHHKGTVYFPPGFGKTLIATLAEIYLKAPLIVIVPTKVLLDQWTSMFAAAGIRAGTYYGEEKRPDWVTIALYQSLYERPEIIRKFPFIVFDEADLATADQFRSLIAEAAHHPYVLAMTGTKPSTDERIRILEGPLPLLARASLAETGSSGSVIVPNIHPIPVSLTGSEQEDYDAATKIIASTSQQIGGGGPEAAARLLHSGTPELRIAARRYLAAYQRRQEVLNSARAKGPAVVQVVRRFPGQRIILFGNRIDALTKTCDRLNELGTPCRVLSGETATPERRDTLENWGRTFQVLAAAFVIQRGFNVPEASVAIIMTSGQSSQTILQRLGRIARTAPGKTHADAFLIYASGTVEEDLPARFQQVIDSG